MNHDPTSSVLTTGKKTLSELHHVGITVSDIERSIRFYRDVLGLVLVRRRSADADYLGQQTGYAGVRLEVASFKVSPESPQSLEIAQYATHAGGSSNAATNLAGNSHLCFRVDDIHALYDSFIAQGVALLLAAGGDHIGPQPGRLRRLFLRPRRFHARAVPAASRENAKCQMISDK